MSESVSSRIDTIGVGINTFFAGVFFTGGMTSEFLQSDLVNRIEAAKAAGFTIDSAVQASYYGHIARMFGEGTANFMNNQMGDLALIPFFMFVTRAALGLISVDGNPNNPDDIPEALIVIDSVMLISSMLILARELKDIINPVCVKATSGCIGDPSDLVAFTVPIIALAIQRRRDIASVLNHIFQHFNPLTQRGMGIE